MMKKKIYILSYPGGLQGVPKDVSNYKAYFKSDCGGAWRDDEIEEINNKNSTEIVTILQSAAHELDFMYVIYLGHGTALYAGAGLVDRGFCLSTSDTLPLAHIKYATSTTRCVVIADTCCGIPTYAAGGRFIGVIKESHTAFTKQCRDYLETAIMASNRPSFAALFSTSIGEEAMDFTIGGCYSVYLLDGAKNLGTLLSASSQPYATIREVHNNASAATQLYAARISHKQTPTCEDGELLDIPFYIDGSKIGIINE